MKIFGDSDSSPYKTYVQEPGFFYGKNDVLKGEPRLSWSLKFDMCGTHETKKMVEPRLHLHISRDAFTTFTGKLREYLLPWRWKTAYLDREDGSQPEKILVLCAGTSDRFRELLGKSWFETNLRAEKVHSNALHKEYLYVPAQEQSIIKRGPFGSLFATHGPFQLCHVFRSRSPISTLKYHLLKHYSSKWKEVTLRVGEASEKVLIKRKDEPTLLNLAGGKMRVV